MKREMSKTTFVWMLTVAIIADLISAIISIIPIFGQVMNPAFSFLVAMILWFWLAVKGLGFQGAIGSGISTLVELIPFLQILPPFTIMVVSIYTRNKIQSIIPGTEALSKIK